MFRIEIEQPTIAVAALSLSDQTLVVAGKYPFLQLIDNSIVKTVNLSMRYGCCLKELQFDMKSYLLIGGSDGFIDIFHRDRLVQVMLTSKPTHNAMI